jgi:hypothetical protein
MICKRCGVSFKCGIAARENSCWCEALPHVPLASDTDQDCLCPDCLSQEFAKLPGVDVGVFLETSTDTTLPPNLVEGEDYYCEGPAMVFTARFLLRRGYCCDSGCRHCPYELAKTTK